MGTLQRVVKLNQLSSDNPGLIDGVSTVISIPLKIFPFKDYVWNYYWEGRNAYL